MRGAPRNRRCRDTAGNAFRAALFGWDCASCGDFGRKCASCGTLRLGLRFVRGLRPEMRFVRHSSAGIALRAGASAIICFRAGCQSSRNANPTETRRTKRKSGRGRYARNANPTERPARNAITAEAQRRAASKTGRSWERPMRRLQTQSDNRCLPYLSSGVLIFVPNR